MRSVAVGGFHALTLALTNEGQVYMWGAVDAKRRVPKSPTHFDKVSNLKMRRMFVSTIYSAALTDDGKLYTWLHDSDVHDDEENFGLVAGYSFSDPSDVDVGVTCYPKCVEALAGMRIVSVAAGHIYMIAATGNGMAFP
jgi:alpha-tubulin suppressor-like RCC1 family protein